MRVEQLMTQSVQCCGPHDTLERAAQLMWENDCGALPVCVENGVTKIAGMITDRDIAMSALFQARPLRELMVGDAMSRELCSCKSTDTLAEAERIMREKKVRRLPVLNEEGGILGMISLADLAQEAARERSSRMKEITGDEVGDVLAAICRPRGTALSA